MKPKFALPLAAFLAVPPLLAQPAPAPAGYSQAQVQAILDRNSGDKARARSVPAGRAGAAGGGEAARSRQDLPAPL